MANNWAITIGVNQYEHLSQKKQLKYAVRDAEQIGKFLKNQAGFNVLPYTDTSEPLGSIQTRPSRSNIWRLLKEGIQQARRVDNFWFFFSGHGALGRDRNDYLLTSDFYPGAIEDTAISVNFVIRCLLDCRPQNIVLVLDMCRDGEADGRKSIAEVGMQTIEQAKHQGIATIFSCGRGEESHEIPEVQHGAFTYALLEGLRDHQTAGELELFLMRRVPQLNKNYGKPAQHPLIKLEPTYKSNFSLLTTQPRQDKLDQFQDNLRSSSQSSRSVSSLKQTASEQSATLYTQGTRSFEFEVLTVNACGEKIEQRQLKSQYLVENLDKTSLEMVVIPGGTFVMGSSERKPPSNEIPTHWVTIQPFLMSKYPITKSQWREVSELEQFNRSLKKLPSRTGSANHPVVQVSWYDAVEFCDRLSKKTGHQYRLPAEAEWEYACRASTTTPFFFGESITTALSNYDGRYVYPLEGTKGINREETTSIHTFHVGNAFGLFDMHGNVWEWCIDHWHENYDGAPTNGDAWVDERKNRIRVMRGGSWRNEPLRCRSSSRQGSEENSLYDNTGFRIVRAIEK